LSGFDEEIKEVEAVHKEKSGQTTELQLEMQRLNHDVERYQAERYKTEREAESLERQHPWIPEQRE
jgi:chromosome segregation ATPase